MMMVSGVAGGVKRVCRATSEVVSLIYGRSNPPLAAIILVSGVLAEDSTLIEGVPPEKKTHLRSFLRTSFYPRRRQNASTLNISSNVRPQKERLLNNRKTTVAEKIRPSHPKMVSTETKSSETLRNGKGARVATPTHSSSSSDEESAEKIRVGREYQAAIPPIIPVPERNLDQCPDRALLVWSPATNIEDQKLDQYISVAKEKYGYNGEQALGMLYWHKHNLQNALDDLPNFTPFPDEWTVEDKVLFEQAFQFHGKSFHRIRQMLPDKSVFTLVKHYYSWKKTRCRTSLMDKHAKKLSARANNGEEGGASDGGSEVGSTDSDSEDKKWIRSGRKSCSPPSTSQSSQDLQDKEGGDSKTSCHNCGVICTVAQVTSKGSLCNSCYTHWRRTGSIRPTVGPAKPRDRHANSVLARSKRKPPRGMYINHDDLVCLSSEPSRTGEDMLKALDREIISLKRQVQINKQIISGLKVKTSPGLGELRPSDNNSRINSRWTNDELLLAVQGIRTHGKDFNTIAEVIGTKTETHVRVFYANHRKRYNLDKLVEEYEAEHGPIASEIKKEADGDTGTPLGSAPSSPTPTKNNKNSAKN